MNNNSIFQEFHAMNRNPLIIIDFQLMCNQSQSIDLMHIKCMSTDTDQQTKHEIMTFLNGIDLMRFCIDFHGFKVQYVEKWIPCFSQRYHNSFSKFSHNRTVLTKSNFWAYRKFTPFSISLLYLQWKSIETTWFDGELFTKQYYLFQM